MVLLLQVAAAACEVIMEGATVAVGLLYTMGCCCWT